jgi:hypothetical protein
MKKAIILKTGEVISLYDRKFEVVDFGHIYVAIDAANNVFDEKELHIIEDTQAFIEENLPDYNTNTNVTLSDDIQCCLDCEAPDYKIENVISQCGQHVEDWESAQIRIDRELLEEAARNFVSQQAKA